MHGRYIISKAWGMPLEIEVMPSVSRRQHQSHGYMDFMAAAALTMTSVFSGSVPLSGVGTLSSPTPGVSAVTGGTW
jgi:hypothetical protein